MKQELCQITSCVVEWLYKLRKRVLPEINPSTRCWNVTVVSNKRQHR